MTICLAPAPSVQVARGDPGSGINPAVALNRRYRVGLALVALLVLVNQLIVQPSLLRLTTDAPLINISGRQRMLSQRLAKGALALEAASDPSERRRRRDELQDVLTLWSNSHESLYGREKDRARRGEGGRQALAAFGAIEPFAAQIREHAARLIASDTTVPARQSLAGILEAEAGFLPGMERIVGLYEAEARAHVNWLIGVGWGLTAFVLIVLGAIGRFILRPASQLIERQVTALQEAHDSLEARVKERTSELAREVELRSKAEERQRSLLEQFSHVGRTTTIGEMASGLAHELNQPLGAIANYAEGCLVALDAPQPEVAEVRGVLGKILATTLRAGAIVKRIRRFVTRHETTQERFEANRLVIEVEEFFRDEALRVGIDFQLELASDLPWLWGDPVQIQQVLVNLARNAIDSLIESQLLAPTIVMSTCSPDSGGVEFAVTDNGEGIPDEQLGRVFDAYFSTREQGMGMGLAISRTILEAHQGRITVKSLRGVRTTFQFTLPAASAEDAGTDGLHR